MDNVRERLSAPALPAPNGPNPQKTRFFQETAAAFEFLALFYQLSAKDQAELNELLRGYVVAAHKGISR